MTAKVKAQRGGALKKVKDVTENVSDSVVAFTPTDVYLEAFRFQPPRRRDPKPPYRIPTMAEVAAMPRSGLVAASTFSGAGGSTLGYRMAGFDVRWANEIAERPAESYRANFPAAEVCVKSIRDVTARALLRALGLRQGQLDLLDGSPPCTSFSTAGRRAETWGDVREHAGTYQRIDDLFFEWIRLVKGVRPRAFVAENVDGLVRGAAKGVAKMILRELRALGYRVECWRLDAQWLGVPQRRERVFFVGVRGDLDVDVPPMPTPWPYRYTVRDALPWLDEQAEVETVRHGDHRYRTVELPASTVMAQGSLAGGGSNAAWLRLVQDTGGKPFGDPDRVAAGKATPAVRDVDPDGPLPTVTGRPSDFRLEARVVHDTKGTGGRADVTDTPSRSITTTSGPQFHVIEDGVLRRKFTILEVKRLCAFPDDFELVGSFVEQWRQLGNSVPPLMARAVGEALRDGAFAKMGQKPPRRRRGAQGRAGRAGGTP